MSWVMVAFPSLDGRPGFPAPILRRERRVCFPLPRLSDASAGNAAGAFPAGMRHWDRCQATWQDAYLAYLMISLAYEAQLPASL
jgi:hypothetical protein